MDRVKEEATALSTFFGEELPSLHSSELAGLGEGKTDGSTRGFMVKEMEKLRATALDKSMAELPDQSERSEKTLTRSHLPSCCPSQGRTLAFPLRTFLNSSWPSSQYHQFYAGGGSVKKWES